MQNQRTDIDRLSWQRANQPNGGDRTLDKVKYFVNDGRKAALRAGLWFLLNEYDKTEENRRVLLISDTLSNQELWIAAIKYALPYEMAQTIPFVTNQSDLDSQPDRALYDYVDGDGFFNSENLESGGGTEPGTGTDRKRHPYHMIVGFDPEDESCALVDAASGDAYALINGAEKAACFLPEESVDCPYYLAAVEYDEKLRDFYDCVLPTLSIRKIGTALQRAYDAWVYLFCSEEETAGWSYKALLTHLLRLLDFYLPVKDCQSLDMLRSCMKEYPRFAREDEKNGYPLQILYKNALTTCKDMLLNYEFVMREGMYMDIHVKNKELARNIYYALNKPETYVFTEEELAGITSISISKKDAALSETGLRIQDMFLFKNLKYVTLRYFSISQGDLELIMRKSSIKEIYFDYCFFGDVDFNRLMRLPEKIGFSCNENMPLRYPKISQVKINGCQELDFDTIDFSIAEQVEIRNARIKNAHGLETFSNIKEVNLDYSLLIGRDGNPMDEISVAKGCWYSHIPYGEYPVDNRL